jgi:hypothetical protein
MATSQLERKSRIQNSETHKHIIKQNTNVAKRIQCSEFTQSVQSLINTKWTKIRKFVRLR